tara:strand:- start:1506 stop:2756 length:1251 start_codon:yes stop_codon:yes gene_type:complete
MLNYKNNQPYIEGVAVNDIIKSYKTPFYVYSQKAITENYVRLKNNLNADIFYAVKANSNQAIIELLKLLGAGVDVVSIGELKRALIAGVDPKKIIFEGVGKSDKDIIFAIEKNIRLINIESINELMLIDSIAKAMNKKVNVGVRINPNIDGKTIDKISTGKKTDKFGISIDNFEDIIDSLKETNNLNLVGISCHVGSQIHNLDVFEKIFKIMKTTTNKFIEAGFNIENLDLGGGLAVQYLDTDPIVELDKLKKIFDLYFKNVKYKISFEPGRYLVANAGCIITNIVAVKNNGGINYLITDAGMNTIVRPALYNAIHRIDAIDVSSNMQIEYSIAGPICESSDILVKNITLPKQTIGNYLVIYDTGAYGHVMASDYNSRGLPAEILINDSMVATIHQPQSIEEIIQQDKIPSWLRSS